MSTCKLYFGPYNDPGGPSGTKHCDLPHDACCCNPAFYVRRAGAAYTVSVAVRNVSQQGSPNDVTVSFYGCDAPGGLTASKLNFVAGRLLNGTLTNIISGQTTFVINPDSIQPFSSAGDRPWIAGPVSLTPSQPRGIVVVATLACPSWNLFHVPGTPPTQDPCVAVWVGP